MTDKGNCIVALCNYFYFLLFMIKSIKDVAAEIEIGELKAICIILKCKAQRKKKIKKNEEKNRNLASARLRIRCEC